MRAFSRSSTSAVAVLALVSSVLVCATAGAFGSKGTAPFPPYRAGLRLSIGDVWCTSGFAVADPGSGTSYGLTAGHCADHGAVHVAGRRVGRILGSRFICCDLVSSDSALFTVPQDEVSATIADVPSRGGLFASLLPASTLHPGTFTENVPVTGYLADSAIVEGIKVCSLGAFGWIRCGHVNRTDYSYRFRGGRKLTGLACYRAPVKEGDSGGPVFELKGGEALAVGLVSIGGRHGTCFTTIEDALAAWNVELLVPSGAGVAALDPSEAIQASPEASTGGRPGARRCSHPTGTRQRLRCLLERDLF
jgi:hypothetical protein